MLKEYRRFGEEIMIEEMDSFIEELRNSLVELENYNYDSEKVNQLIVSLIEEQDKDGFWGIIPSPRVDGDIRVLYWYTPTYIASAIMMKCWILSDGNININGFKESLIKGLEASTGRGFNGHGADDIKGRLEAVEIYNSANVSRFIKEYPGLCPIFTDVFNKLMDWLRSAVETSNTKGQWGEDYKDKMIEVLNDFDKTEEDILVFVYGTLMRGNSNHRYLSTSQFIGEGTVKGFTMYDLGYFPGIKNSKEGIIKGEVYKVNRDTLMDLDRLEGEGHLYNREMITVSYDSRIINNVYIYVYKGDVSSSRIVPLSNQPSWNRNLLDKNKDYIWYACYGSNINTERFMEYIRRCKDNRLPKEEKPYMINHPIYFSKSSEKWDYKSVAFLDISIEGLSYGKIYLITSEQFDDIRHQEGPGWYNKEIDLGIVDGVPVKTFTHYPRYAEDTKPSKKYLNIIKNGIKDTYTNLIEIEIDAYLMESYLRYEEIRLLQFLRNQAHGVSIGKISDELNLNYDRVVQLVNVLSELELIKKDGGRMNRDRDWDSIDAIYYTIENRRETIDKVVRNINEDEYGNGVISIKYIKQMDKQTLMNKINSFTLNPVSSERTILDFVRSPYIKEYAKRRADGVCELCNQPAPFNNSDGEPFLEVHHIKWLSDGGSDSIDNTVALCPNCHRKIHILNDSEDINKLLTVEKVI